MKPTAHHLENLLALKRHERPAEGYWDDFLCEFHQRQREQAANRSSLGMCWDRTRSFFADLGAAKWVYGAGLAYALVTVGFFLAPRSVDLEQAPAAPVHREVPVEAEPVEQLHELDLSPSTRGHTGEQIF